MKLEIRYRQAQMEDLDGIAELVKNAIVEMESNGIMQWDELYPTNEDFQRDICRKQLYIGSVNNQIAVVFALNKESDEEYQNGRWEEPERPFYVLHRLCVNPKFQNNGVAKSTISYIEDKLIREGIEAIRLDAFSLNPYALKLYGNCGYKEVGMAEWRKGTFYLMEKYLEEKQNEKSILCTGDC